MIYDLDKRKTLRTLSEVMSFEFPFSSFMGNEVAYGDDCVIFTYSCITPDMLVKLMELEIRHDGKLFKFNRIEPEISRTGAYENPEDPTEETIISELAVMFN